MGQVNHRDQRAIAGKVEAPGGVEPPTRSLGNCCSIHLSYGASLDDNKLSHASLARSQWAKLKTTDNCRLCFEIQREAPRDRFTQSKLPRLPDDPPFACAWLICDRT